MSRPKKGTEAGRLATMKWRETMLAKYGSEEKLHEKMVAMGRKGGKLSRNGGFASSKVGKDGLTGLERARLVGVIGGRKSKRGPSKENLKKIDVAYEEWNQIRKKLLLK